MAIEIKGTAYSGEVLEQLLVRATTPTSWLSAD
jgi:hypothetical protein